MLLLCNGDLYVITSELVASGNNELEWYTPSNAHVSQGKLVLTASKYVTGNSASYTSSKIVSRGKADFGVVPSIGINKDMDSNNKSHLETSRRFEARMKLPWGQGIWPAFWMLPTLSTFGGWPKVCDIFRYLSLPLQFGFTIYSSRAHAIYLNLCQT